MRTRADTRSRTTVIEVLNFCKVVFPAKVRLNGAVELKFTGVADISTPAASETVLKFLYDGFARAKIRHVESVKNGGRVNLVLLGSDFIEAVYNTLNTVKPAEV